MQFITAIGTHSDLKTLREVLEARPDYRELLGGILISPLVAPKGLLRMVREFKKTHGVPVMFDSGGFQVATGTISYPDLLSTIKACYQEHDWADTYTLPDHVPHSDDDEDTILGKVEDTIRESVRFYHDMAPDLQKKAIAVIQGKTPDLMGRCLDAYRDAGIRHVGFGGFAVGGKSGSPKILGPEVIEEIRRVAEDLASSDQTLHVFGIGSVRTLPFLGHAGVTSTDATNWSKAAGFGWVFLPMTGNYGVGCSRFDQGQRDLALQKFLSHKEMIGHSCPWCEDTDELATSKRARSRHNLCAVFDTVALINRKDWLEVRRVFSFVDSTQARRWREFTQETPRQLDLFSA